MKRNYDLRLWRFPIGLAEGLDVGHKKEVGIKDESFQVSGLSN